MLLKGQMFNLEACLDDGHTSYLTSYIAVEIGEHFRLQMTSDKFQHLHCSQVTVYGRARLGQDVFLGEVVIPLREVETTADASHSNPDIRRYILGRRNAKEKVL